MIDVLERLAPTAILLIAAVAIIGMVLLRTYRRLGRRPKHSRPIERLKRPVDDPVAHHLDAPDSLARWEVTMCEIERDVSARLDTKMAALSQLIRAADEATERLEQHLGESDRTPGAERPPPAARDLSARR